MTILPFFLIVVVLILSLILIGKNNSVASLKENLYLKDREMEQQEIEFQKREKAIREDAKKRSTAIIWGKSIEHFIPFTEKFPIPPEDATFLGQPIDYIAFTKTSSKKDCEIHFIEIKSGKSPLSTKQRNIKQAVLEKRIVWHEVNIETNKEKED